MLKCNVIRYGAICALGLVLAMTSSVHAFADDPKATRSKLIALENAWNQAQLHHDAKALEGLVADSFIYTDTDGSVQNKAQFMSDIRDPEFRPTMITNEDVRVDVFDNAAVVAGTYHTKGSYKGKSFDHYGRFTDTWISLNGQWRCVASATTLIQK